MSLVERFNEWSVIDMIHVTNYKCNNRLGAKMLNETCIFSLLSERNELITSFESKIKNN